jgi:hypothetical protein
MDSLYISVVIYEWLEYTCNDADMEKPKNLDKNLSLCHSPGIEPGLRSKKPATDTLNKARL